ncbi:hypothetical protein CJM129_9405 (plasmid) [Campylobacter jejuni subsp. jejuni M129]|nr:hypothetical protein CJM129_9405 [Campylobacter jejuni subsp. jejuni M129]APA81995.1 hypothetical protein CJD42_9165 [Campylobacter jejuni subsp. jejuni D42a]
MTTESFISDEKGINFSKLGSALSPKTDIFGKLEFGGICL